MVIRMAVGTSGIVVVLGARLRVLLLLLLLLLRVTVLRLG